MIIYEKPCVIDAKKSDKTPTINFSPPQKEKTQSIVLRSKSDENIKMGERPAKPELKSESSEKKCCD